MEDYVYFEKVQIEEMEFEESRINFAFEVDDFVEKINVVSVDFEANA